MITGRETGMEVVLGADRYMIMEWVSRQEKQFRFAELYYLLKKAGLVRWQARDVKITLEWLADMGLVRRKKVKEKPGQRLLFYQPCFDHDFLPGRIKPEDGGNCMEAGVYICRGTIEILRYKYACIKEKYNRAFWSLPNKSPFVIAEMEFAVPMTPEEKQLLKKKIEDLDN